MPWTLAKKLWMQHRLRQDWPRLIRYAERLTRNPSAADDLVQFACEKAMRRLDQLQDRSKFRGWMFQIIRTTHIDQCRKPALPELAEVLPLPTPDHVVEDRQLGVRIAAAIDLLPGNQREAVWLVDVEQLTFAEAAVVLGVRPGTVASRVARGRAALRVDLRADAAERGIGG